MLLLYVRLGDESHTGFERDNPSWHCTVTNVRFFRAFSLQVRTFFSNFTMIGESSFTYTAFAGLLGVNMNLLSGLTDISLCN